MPAAAVPPVSSCTLTGNRTTQSASVVGGTLPSPGSPGTTRAVSTTSWVSPSTTDAGSATTTRRHASLSGIATSTRSAPRAQPVPPPAIDIESEKRSSSSTSTSSTIATVPVFTATWRGCPSTVCGSKSPGAKVTVSSTAA